MSISFPVLTSLQLLPLAEDETVILILVFDLMFSDFLASVPLLRSPTFNRFYPYRFMISQSFPIHLFLFSIVILLLL